MNRFISLSQIPSAAARLAVVLICLNLAGWAQLAPERMVLSSLEKGKYPKAYTQITRMLVRDTGSVAARFLLVRYFFEPTNPDYNIDSAHHYCRAGMASLAHTHGKARERLIRFAIDSAAFQRLQQSIDSAAFKRAKDLNTEAAYQYFLDRFPQAQQRNLAIELRDEVAFLTALRENTWQSFKHFLDKYPQSHRAPDAQVRYDRLLYQTKTSDGRLNSYRTFVAEHPGSPYRHEAEWHILQISTAVCTPQSLLDFVTTYPHSRHRRFALNLLYHLLKEHDEPFPSGLLTDSLRHVNNLEKQHLIPVYRNGKFGWMNPGGKEVIAPMAEYLPETLKCGYAEDDVLPAGNLLIARNGTVLARQVEDFTDLGYGFLLIETNDCNYVLHKSGKKLTGCIDDARVVGGSIMAVQTDNRWSLLSFAGLVLMENTDGFYDFGPVLGIKKGTQTLLMLLEGIKLLADGQQPRIQHVVDETKNLTKGIWVRMGKNEAVLGYDLTWLIPPSEQHIEPCLSGYLLKDAYGYRFWKPGSAASPYGVAAQIRHPWVALQQHRGWQVYYKTPSQPLSRYFDSLQFTGPVLVCPRPDSTYVYFNHSRSLAFTGRPKVWFRPGTDSLFYIQVDLPEGKALYNAQGQHLFTADVQQILYAGEGYFEATKNNKKGLLNAAGNWVIPAEFDALGPVQKGWISTLRNNRFGMRNLALQKEIRPEYDNNLKPYTAGLLIATRQNAWGLINWENKPEIPLQFDEIIHWTDTVLLVRKNFQWMLFNRITQKTALDHIQSFTWVKNTPADKTIIFLRNGYYGVAGSRSGIILQPTFTRVLNLGTQEEPFYFTEKYIEEAGIYVVIYYDRQGRLVHRLVLEEDEFESLRCNR